MMSPTAPILFQSVLAGVVVGVLAGALSGVAGRPAAACGSFESRMT